MKKIIIYYSYTGNTKKVAQYIKNKLHCDLLELEPKIPYSDDYDIVVNQGQDEVNTEYTPLIKDIEINLKDYDEIILGSPIWWYTFAPVVRTFLNDYDLKDKKIYPFLTNGGYGLGHSIKDMKELTDDAIIMKALDIPFENDEMQIDESIIDKWLKEMEE